MENRTSNVEKARANEWKILRWVGAFGQWAGINERRLAKSVGIKDGQVANVLGRCVRKGLVQLRDGRYQLTALGVRELAAGPEGG